MIGSDHLSVRLALPGLLNAAGHGAMPAPYSHTEGRLLPYDAEAAPVQRCLRAAVTAAQGEPSLAPWLGPAEQHAYGSITAAALDKVFEHLHAAHDALARVVGRRQPSPAGLDPAGGNPPESGKRLQAAIPRYDTLAACAPSAYQANAARHGIQSEAALRLTEELRGASLGFRPATQGQLQEKLGRQAAALVVDIRHLRALLEGHRKRAIRDFWRRQAQDIAEMESRARGHRGRGPGPIGPVECAGPQHPNAPHRGPQRDVRGPRLLAGTVRQTPGGPPRFPGGPRPPRASGPRGGLDPGPAVIHAGPAVCVGQGRWQGAGPNHVEASFIKALPAPVQWLPVQPYRAILRGAPPPMHWRHAHIWLSPKVPGSA